jgi:hypothetical protein
MHEGDDPSLYISYIITYKIYQHNFVVARNQSTPNDTLKQKPKYHRHPIAMMIMLQEGVLKE